MMNEFLQPGSGGSVAGGYTAYVVSGNGKSVVLRSGPSKQDDVLASYPVGKKVTVHSYGSTWCHVSVDGTMGYMMSEFLSTVKPDSSGSASYTAYVTSQNGKGVRMRMGAGKYFPTIATYSVGTRVTVLAYDEDWCKVRVGTNTGYMMTDFLTTNAPSMVKSVTLNADSVKPGDTLRATVSPSSASVSITWMNDRGNTLGYGNAYTVRESDVGRRIRASVTGNRRFCPVKTPGGGTKHSWDLSAEDIRQIWAEVLEYVNAGEKLHLDPEIEIMAKEEQREALESDEREGLVREYLETLLPEDWDNMDLFERRSFLSGVNTTTRVGSIPRTRVCNMEIWCELFGKDQGNLGRAESNNLAAMLHKMGWVKQERKVRIKPYGPQVVYVPTNVPD